MVNRRTRPERLPLAGDESPLSEADNNSPPSSGSGDIKRHRSQGRLSQIFPIALKPEKFEFLNRLASLETASSPTIDQYLPRIPTFPVPDLEDHWTVLVQDGSALPRKLGDEQEAIWELITTERQYLKELRTLIEMLHHLLDLQSDAWLSDVSAERVFGNLTEVWESCVYFWQNSVALVLAESRETSASLDSSLFETVFARCRGIFKPYIEYCIQQANLVHYIRKKQKENDYFKEFVLWVQTHKTMGRLQLTDILIKPMHRLTRYPLLLKAIAKHTQDVGVKRKIEQMVQNVEGFLNHVNCELQLKHQQESLCQIMATIESYDIIDPINDEVDKHVRPYSHLDLTRPMIGCSPKVMRTLLWHGEMKLRDSYAKLEVHCLLFTDMFLVCKQTGKKGDRPRVRVIRSPYHIDALRVHGLRDINGFLVLNINQFGICDTAFTLQTPNTTDSLKWLEQFRLAKDSYAKHKDQFREQCVLQQGMALHPSDHIDTISLNGSAVDLCVSPPPAPWRKKSGSAELLSPSVLASPCRRVSIGAMESARRNIQSVETPGNDTSVSHGRSSSMDSTALQSARGTREWSSSTSTEEAPFSPVRNLRDCLSSSNLIHQDRYDSSEDLMTTYAQASTRYDSSQASTPAPPANQPPDKYLNPARRMHAIRKRFSPRNLQNISADRFSNGSSTGNSPLHSPSHSIVKTSESAYVFLPESELCLDMTARQKHTTGSDCLESPSGTITPRNPSSGGSMETLIPSECQDNSEVTVSLERHKSEPRQRERKINWPKHPTFSADHGESDRRVILKTQRSISPFRKPSIPEPVFYAKAAKVQEVPEEPKPNVKNQNSQKSASPLHGRRLERRYHTAGAIEDLKPKTQQPAHIKKRFSWNTNYERPKEFTSQIPPLFEQLRDGPGDSNTCSLSSESFCTSSSGFSSSSSHVCYSPSSGNDHDKEPQTDSVVKRGLVEASLPIVQCTRPIFAAGGPPNRDNVSTIVVDGPSSPCVSPDVPRIETQEATPMTSPISSSASVESFQVRQEPPSAEVPLKEEMLRMILENKLEASDV